VLTEVIVRLVGGHLAPLPLTRETVLLIERHRQESPMRDTRYRELALVVAHGLSMIGFVLGVAVVGALSFVLGGAPGSGRVIYEIAVVGLAWCCAGLAFHLLRYYAALVARRGGAEASGADWRWPRASSDLDFVAQAVVAVLALALS
jgi:hypothetical protein